MTPVAETPRVLPGHRPSVGFVAIKTSHSLLHVETVLTYLGLVSVTFTQAILGFQLYLPVGLMTFKALECGHGPADREFVAPETSLF